MALTSAICRAASAAGRQALRGPLHAFSRAISPPSYRSCSRPSSSSFAVACLAVALVLMVGLVLVRGTVPLGCPGISVGLSVISIVPLLVTITARLARRAFQSPGAWLLEFCDFHADQNSASTATSPRAGISTMLPTRSRSARSTAASSPRASIGTSIRSNIFVLLWFVTVTILRSAENNWRGGFPRERGAARAQKGPDQRGARQGIGTAGAVALLSDLPKHGSVRLLEAAGDLPLTGISDVAPRAPITFSRCSASVSSGAASCRWARSGSAAQAHVSALRLRGHR